MTRSGFAAAFGLLLVIGGVVAAPFGTAFTYQGALRDAGAPASGAYDLQITPYAAGAGGVPLAPAVVVEDIAVADGVFTASVDFGPGFFVGDAVFLEIAVRAGASTGGFQQLLPRQAVSAVPYAQKVRAGSVSSIELAPGAVTTPSLGTGSVGADALATGAAGADEIATNAVGGDEIATNAVGGDEVATGAIGSDEIATNAVGGDEIAPDAVAASELANGAVDTAAILDLNVTGAKLANGAVDAAKLAPGAVGAVHVDPAQIQVRPEGICPAGHPLLGLGADGVVYCDQQPRVIRRTTSGDETNVVLLASDGRPLVVHSFGFRLERLQCDDALCTSSLTEELATNPGTSAGSAVRRSNGRPIVALRDTLADSISVIDCSSSDCSTGTERLLASANDVGRANAIAVRADDRAVVAWVDTDGASNTSARFIECTTVSCSSFNPPRTLEPTVNGDAIDIVVRSDDRPLVAYSTAGGVGDRDLRLYDCANAGCTSGTARTIDGAGPTDSAGSQLDLFMRADGRPAIAYLRSTGGDLAFYDCADANCASGTVRLLDTAGSTGRQPSVARRPDGRPVIAYNTQSVGLRLYSCADVNCTNGVARTLDGLDAAGFAGTSVAVRADDRPVLAYRAAQGALLKLFVCARPDCASAP